MQLCFGRLMSLLNLPELEIYIPLPSLKFMDIAADVIDKMVSLDSITIVLFTCILLFTIQFKRMRICNYENIKKM